MRKWLGMAGGATGIAVIWAVAWTAIGALIRTLDPSGSVAALWLGPEIGMAPGFLGGVLFAVATGITLGRRGLAASSLPRIVLHGAMAGLAVGVLPFAINPPPREVPLWLVGAVVIGSMTFLGAITAAGSRALARRVSAGRQAGIRPL